jgi:IS4 transposase
MILGDVFDRFAQDSPLTVMAQGVMENALNPAIVDQLFEDVADTQYTRKLLFSSVVDLMGLVVCRIKPAINAAYKARAATIEVSVKAIYDKLDRIEPAISAALVGATARRLEPVIDAMDGACAPLLPGYRVKILDGNHLASTEHRIQELRTLRAGALPGQALVVLDPRLMLVTDVVLCEDGHAQERSLLDRVFPLVAPKDVWIDDRNFCTTGFLFGIAARQAFFVTRQHASTLHWEFAGRRRRRGRIETGEVFEQTIRASNDAGEILILRRITVVLDKPTRDGDREIHLLTNLPRQGAPARVIAELYRRRWTIETAFAELAETLNGEVNTLGYPKAALFAFCVALVAYNVLSTVKAALRSVHGEQRVAAEVSAYYVAEEVQMTHRGMMIAIPEDEWVVFHDMTPRELGAVLVELATAVRMAEYRKQPRGPKKPPPKKQSGAKTKHVATAKVLAARKKCTT